MPWMVRWNAVDPLEDENTPFSPYNYCDNNPIMFHDPTGADADPAGGGGTDPGGGDGTDPGGGGGTDPGGNPGTPTTPDGIPVVPAELDIFDFDGENRTGEKANEDIFDKNGNPSTGSGLVRVVKRDAEGKVVKDYLRKRVDGEGTRDENGRWENAVVRTDTKPASNPTTATTARPNPPAPPPPPPPPPVPPDPNIWFHTGGSRNNTYSSYTTLFVDPLIEYLNKYPNKSITIEGNSSEDATDEKLLSRANMARDIIIKRSKELNKTIKQNRIKTKKGKNKGGDKISITALFNGLLDALNFAIHLFSLITNRLVFNFDIPWREYFDGRVIG